MSTLKATNIKNESSASNNIVLDSGGGAIFSGVTTFSSSVNFNSIGSLTLGTGTTIGAATSNTFIVSTNGSERVRVDSLGNVGIGTTNPTSKLSLHSGYDVTLSLTADTEPNIKLNTTDNSRNLTIFNSSGNFGITEYYNSESNTIIYHSNSSGVSANQYTSFGVGGEERLRINGGGNILIGSATSTGTASQKLQVTGGAYVSGNLGIGTTNPVTRLQVGSATSQAVFITSTGLVGLGSTAPRVSLDASQETDAIALPQGTTSQRPTGNAPYIRYNTTNSALEFYNGTDWVEIISDYFPSGSTILG